jgi:hypothetical protein
MPVITTPRAVPAAGGCSVSVTTIVRIEAPTAIEYIKSENIKAGCGNKENTNPKKRPTRWPPITFLAWAVMLSGIVNTIKAVAPIEAIMTAFCKLRKYRTINTDKVARRLCMM